MLEFNAERHEYKLNGVVIPSVTQILKAAGLSDFSGVNADLLQRSANFGTAVHKAIELRSKGTLDNNSVDEGLKSYLLQWDAFASQFKFESKKQEIVLCHESLKFAGTIDNLGEIDGVETLIDVKTGTPRPSDIIQLCAYGMLYFAKRLRLMIVYEQTGRKANQYFCQR
jgi:hypothetical protein